MRIDFEQLHSSINQQLIAGRFGQEDFPQLHTKHIEERSKEPLQH